LLQIENSITGLAKLHLILAANIFCCSTYILTITNKALVATTLTVPILKKYFSCHGYILASLANTFFECTYVHPGDRFFYFCTLHYYFFPTARTVKISILLLYNFGYALSIELIINSIGSAVIEI